MFNPSETALCDCGFDFEHAAPQPSMSRSTVLLRFVLSIAFAIPSVMFGMIALADSWFTPPLWSLTRSTFVLSLHPFLSQAARLAPVTTAIAVWLCVPVLQSVSSLARTLIIVVCALSTIGAMLFWLPYLGWIFPMPMAVWVHYQERHSIGNV
jgi:hypothetical protein